MRFFEQFRLYFIAACKAIIWSVCLVALLLAAYCAIRLLGNWFHYVNEAWFHGLKGMHLFLAALLIMALGPVFQFLKACWKRRKTRVTASTTAVSQRKGPGSWI